MYTKDDLALVDGMNKLKLRAGCRAASIKGYSKMNVEAMRVALKRFIEKNLTDTTLLAEVLPAQITTPAEVNREPEHEDCCPLCAGDPSNQTWATEGKTCFCHECGKSWSIKTRKEVRTGHKRNGAATPCKVEKDREERNGIKRPSAGGACDRVWSWLDRNPDAQLKDVREMARKRGLNEGNAAIELYQFRKFNGIASKRAK